MRKIKWLVIPILLASILGCAETRQFTLKASEEYIANTQTAIQVVDNLSQSWDFDSGVLRCGLGPSLEDSGMLPTIERLDEVVKRLGQFVDEDYDKGCFLGLQMRLAVKASEEMIRRLLPIITRYVGAL